MEVEIMIKKMKEKILKYINDFACDQNGIGSIELVLILLVLVGLIVIFRENIMSIIDTVFGKVTAQINSF